MKEKKSNISRRNFIKNASGALAAATVAAPLYIPQNVFGANDTIRAAVLGVNGRGKGHIESLMNLENVEVVTLCDPDQNVLDKRATEFEVKYNKKVALEQDLRKVFDDIVKLFSSGILVAFFEVALAYIEIYFCQHSVSSIRVVDDLLVGFNGTIQIAGYFFLVGFLQLLYGRLSTG